MAEDLVKRTVETILERIAAGEYPPDQPFPGEIALADSLDVSRLTLREATKALRERGVVRVVRGRGTFVNSMSRWTDLPTVIQSVSRTLDDHLVGMHLIEIRRMIEVGAAGLAALNHSATDIQIMQGHLDAIDEAEEALDIETIVQHDLDFHDAILAATGNPFIRTVFQPLKSALFQNRLRTSSVSEVRVRAQGHHRSVLAAIAAKDAQAAKDAMRAHMTQTSDDIERFLQLNEKAD